MIFRPTRLEEVVVVVPEPREDERGSFARVFDVDEFAAHGLETRFVQANVGRSRRAGTVRGLHWQEPPHAEAKLVRCTRGAVFDVAVDVRDGSPSRHDWVGVELAADDGRMLYVPPGFAHGYQSLTDDAEIHYLVSAAYAPAAERGLRWDDPALGIAWPRTEGVLVSPKDRAWPLLRGGARSA